MPGEALVECLDQADEHRAENGSGQIADSPEHGGGERDQPDREAGVVADRLEVEGEQDACRSGKSTREQEDEPDRPVDVDPHHRRRVLVLRGGAHRLPAARVAHEPDEPDENRDGDQDRKQPIPRIDDAVRTVPT